MTPNRSNKVSNLGANPTPTNDTSPLGGAIDTGTAVNQDTVGNFFGDMRIGTSDIAYYAVIYERFNNTSTGSMQNARVANRAGARLNTSSATVTVVSTSALDVGSIRVIGKVSGVFTSEDIVLTGTTPAIGVNTFDTNSVIRYESLSGVPTGNITCSVSSEICGIIWGTSADPADGVYSIATYMATAEIDLAVATAINTTLSSANRLTAPTGISAFSKATRWTGEDSSAAVPGGALGVGDYIGIVARFVSFTGIPPSYSGKIQFKHGIVGDATA
jgi:hypothetical protein